MNSLPDAGLLTRQPSMLKTDVQDNTTTEPTNVWVKIARLADPSRTMNIPLRVR